PARHWRDGALPRATGAGLGAWRRRERRAPGAARPAHHRRRPDERAGRGDRRRRGPGRRLRHPRGVHGASADQGQRLMRTAGETTALAAYWGRRAVTRTRIAFPRSRAVTL